MPVEYYEASIILSGGGPTMGGFTGNTPEEADEKARALINTGELFPEPVRVRLAKCIFVSEQPAFKLDEE